MVLAAILSLLLGAVLGLRFRVFVLVPVTGFAWLLFLVLGTDGDVSGGMLAVGMLLMAAALQGGFICGSSTRMVMAAARATRRRRNWQPVSTGSQGTVG